MIKHLDFRGWTTLDVTHESDQHWEYLGNYDAVNFLRVWTAGYLSDTLHP